MFDVQSIRQHFPIFTHHPKLVYLDSAATAQKPREMLDAIRAYYEEYNTNIARGIYPLAEEATEKFEAARTTIAQFIGASKPEEIIFTAGTTASLNLVGTLLSPQISEKNSIVVTAAEHHSNFLPWKELATSRHASLTVVPVTTTGEIDTAALAAAITPETTLVALTAVSNVLGIINPLRELTTIIRSKNPQALIVVDAAQAVGHLPVNVVDWDVDFLAFSGHKIFSPTGIGVLYGRYDLLKKFPPTTFGGGMVLDACAPETVYKDIPARFEAGTPHIAGVIGLAAAIHFVQHLGISAIREHEQALIAYTLRRLKEEFGNDITLLGTNDPAKKSGIISFALVGIHPHDIASLLGEHDICVRAGLQCAAPLHESLGLPASTRISLSVYNSEHDIEVLIQGLKKVRVIL